jgi:hypothetical protein
MSVNPLVFGSFSAYKFVPLLLITGLAMAIRYFVLSMLGQGRERTTMWLLTSLLFLLSMVDLPGGLYYLGGSLFYQPGNILLAILAGNFLLHPPPASLKNLSLVQWSRGFFQGLLLVLLAGCNEIGMLLALAFPCLGFFWHILTKKEISAGWLLLMIPAASACLLILMSPATHYRMEASGSNSRALMEIAFLASSGLMTCLFRWFCSPALLVVLITLFVYCPGGFLNNMSAKRFRSLISLASLLIFYACFLPSYLGEGLLQGRTENSLLFLFILLSTFNIAIWKGPNPASENPGKWKQILLALSILSLSAAPAFRQAVSDLWSGEAAAFSAERDARHRLMLETPGDTVRIPALRHKPKSLFAGDIGDYPDPWYDNHFAALYGKKWVELEKKK